MKKLILMLMFLFVMLNVSHAAEKFTSFEGKNTVNIPDAFKAWHNKFENNKDYGESWFFMVQTDDGGVLFALATITNLGLRTFDGIVDAQFYTPDGKNYSLHSENKRDSIKASTDKMDVKIGKTRTWGSGSNYHFTTSEKDMQIKLDVTNVLPSYMFGNGTVHFFEDRSSEWSIGINTTRGKSSGQLTVGGKTYSLKGRAYHDHGWATIKMPEAFSKWFALRIYDPKYTLVLHKQFLTKKFGSGRHTFGYFGTNEKLIGSTRNFAFDLTNVRKDKKSGYSMPTAFKVSVKTGGYTVTGTVKESRFLESIDVLGQVSWPVRIVIKAFYSKPYMHRYIAQYELDITDNEGKTEHISGQGVVEANFF